jgi:hypothetical protein
MIDLLGLATTSILRLQWKAAARQHLESSITEHLVTPLRVYICRIMAGLGWRRSDMLCISLRRMSAQQNYGDEH